jgi:hypothetical protein
MIIPSRLASPLRLILVAGLIALITPSHGVAAEKSLEKQAFELLDAASAKWKSLKDYAYVSRRPVNESVVETRGFFHRDETGFCFIREERTVLRNGEPGRGGRNLFIRNREGCWTISRNVATRRNPETWTDTRTPVRLRTGNLLKINATVETTLDDKVEWLGHHCTRVTFTLPAEGIAAVRRHLDEKPAAGINHNLASLPAYEVAKIQALTFPVGYVYLIDQATGVIIQWQAIGCDGEVLTEKSYQDFRIETENHPEHYVLPEDCKIVEAPKRTSPHSTPAAK